MWHNVRPHADHMPVTAMAIAAIVRLALLVLLVAAVADGEESGWKYTSYVNIYQGYIVLFAFTGA